MYGQLSPCISWNHKIGRLGETCSVRALHELRNVGVTIEHHNSFDDYEYCKGSGRGVDIHFKIENKRVLTEVKNIRGYVCKSWLLKHVITRFLEIDPDHQSEWLLIISKKNCVSKRDRVWLNAHSVTVVEIGSQVNNDNWWRLLGKLKDRLLEYIRTIYPLSRDCELISVVCNLIGSGFVVGQCLLSDFTVCCSCWNGVYSVNNCKRLVGVMSPNNQQHP